MAALLVVVCCCAGQDFWRYHCPVALPCFFGLAIVPGLVCVGTVHESMRGQNMYVSFCLLEVLRGDCHYAGRRSVVWRRR
jgi:hypothetical protein